ncbi:MAG: ABC transporter substrate-binding protein [Firmicutes bacterium]|nr:ABC transporter substrate-binding protein [Bacillota bacterium]
MKKRKLIVLTCLMLIMTMTVMLTACGNNSKSESGEAETATETTSTKPTEDRAGNPITIPDEVNKIVALAPSIMQTLDAFGVMDKVVGTDTQTPFYVTGVDSLPQFDLMEPDIEQIAALEPDVVFTTGMSYSDGDPFAALSEMGICVVCIPSSNSIAAIKEDIQFLADCIGNSDAATPILEEFQKSIDEVKAIGDTITEKKTVMFEIGALPYLYSCGQNTFIDEMITLIGAENVFHEQDAWISVAEEDAVAANPDVILTSVNYIEDPVGEILGRPGWENVNAVKNKEVYYIDNGSSSLPNQNIILALHQMAEAVYPDAYEYTLDQAA